MSEREQENGETVETTRVVEVTESRQSAEAGITPAGGAELEKVRELVLQAHPEVVPDLVRGNSVDELIASVEPARQAYQRIADRVRGGETTVTAEAGSTVNAEGQTTVVVKPPAVPAGGAANVVEPAELAPQTKIAKALAERRRK